MFFSIQKHHTQLFVYDCSLRKLRDETENRDLWNQKRKFFFLANGPRNSMMEEANASKGVNQNLMVQLPEWLLTSQ